MPVYSADFVHTLSTTASWGSFGASSATQARRGRLLYAAAGSQGTPADAAVQITFQRYTADGTSTAVTPQPLDPADAAFLGEAGEVHTVEPTYTAGAIVLNFSYHIRQGFVYYAPPGAEIVYPATDDSGIGIKTPTISAGGTLASTLTVHILE